MRVSSAFQRSAWPSRLLVALMALGLLSCATEARYREILATWNGAEEGQLIASWGAPSSYFIGYDETRYLTYQRGRTAVLPGNPPKTEVDPATGYVRVSPGTPDMTLNFACKTTFEIQNGVIVNARFRGNDCVAY